MDTNNAAWRAARDRFDPVAVDELPGIARDMAGYIDPLAVAPGDWAPTLALAFWSALVPGARCDGRGLNLWWLGVAPAGEAATAAGDELYRVVTAAADVRGQRLTTATSGSPEGLARRLQGSNAPLLAYHADYVATLDQARRRPETRELLANLHDGRDLAHQLPGETIAAREPYAVVVAHATVATLTGTATRDDLTTGYLSRFLFCAPDPRDAAPGAYPGDERRAELVQKLCKYTGRAAAVRRVEIPDDSPSLAAYRRRLGLDTGRVRDLATERADIPPDRLVVRARKLAALLALADDRTDVLDNTVRACENHIQLAVRLTGRAEAYRQRAARWLGATKEERLRERVLALLAERGELASRDLQIATRTKARPMGYLLGDLEAAGLVERIPVGKSWVYRPRE